MSTTLTRLADWADLLIAGPIFEQPVANVAEYYDIPSATLHYFPVRAHGQLLPFLPSPLIWLRNDDGRLAVLARDEEGRGRAAP